MITVIATLKVNKGSEAEFETLMKDLVKKVDANEPGTLTYVLNQSQSDPCTFMVYEIYKDQEALQNHGGSDYFKTFMKESGALMAEKPVIVLCREVAKLSR